MTNESNCSFISDPISISSIPYSSTANGSSTKIVVVEDVVVLSSAIVSIGSTEISNDEGSEPQAIKVNANKVNKYFLIGN